MVELPYVLDLAVHLVNLVTWLDDTCDYSISPESKSIFLLQIYFCSSSIMQVSEMKSEPPLPVLDTLDMEAVIRLWPQKLKIASSVLLIFVVLITCHTQLSARDREEPTLQNVKI